MLQHTSSEVNGYNCYKHFKKYKNKEGNWWQDKNNDKALSQGCHAFVLADHVISTGHNIKWDHFDIFTTGKSDFQCKIKETLLISELKPSLNENVGSEKLFLY